MPARRSLRLDASESNKNEKTKTKTTQDPSSYSPLTGTRKMSPPSVSKRRAAVVPRQGRRPDNTDHAKSAAPGKSSRGQSATEDNSELLELFSRVEKSLGAFVKMRQGLKNLQALEGSRELGTVTGSHQPALDLQTEMQRAKVLICEVRKLKMQPSTS
ncbi:centromere protein R [Pseudophryne corroboree]|uniref:centromere protein R n=1 Tax=Pseudophryne corroboree TaxID=495146 RepID=UPI003081F554